MAAASTAATGAAVATGLASAVEEAAAEQRGSESLRGTGGCTCERDRQLYFVTKLISLSSTAAANPSGFKLD